MSSIFIILLVVILFACVAMLYNEGIWSNALRLINVIMAALLATNFFEPVARWLDDMVPSCTYVWDFLSLWVLFAVFVTVFRLLTDQISQVKVRFLGIVDQIGGAFLAVWIAWVMVCFTTMTLHTAPLSRNFLFGGFNAEERMFMGFAPDRQWLGFMQKMSMGTFSSSARAGEPDEKYVFDPRSVFVINYSTRRQKLQENVIKSDSIRVSN
jgi:hypothetical protein